MLLEDARAAFVRRPVFPSAVFDRPDKGADRQRPAILGTDPKSVNQLGVPSQVIKRTTRPRRYKRGLNSWKKGDAMPGSDEAAGRRAAILTSTAAATCLTLASGLAVADVVSSAPGGFILRVEIAVAAAPADVYSKFFEVGRWWSDAHTYTGKSANLTLKNEPGACFCEALAGGGFVRHASLEYSDPGRIARLSGALGPLQAMGAHGLLDFNFIPADKAKPQAGTKLVVNYVVSGHRAGDGFAPLAAPVNEVITEQVTRLKRFAETGKP
jgi:hypothetical protein